MEVCHVGMTSMLPAGSLLNSSHTKVQFFSTFTRLAVISGQVITSMTTSILQLFECLKTCEWFVKLEAITGQIKKCIFSDMFLIHLPFLVAYLTFEIIIKGLGSKVFCSCSFQKRTPEVYLKVFSIFFCCSFLCFYYFFLVVLSGFFSSVQFSVVLSFLVLCYWESSTPSSVSCGKLSSP